MEYSTTDAIPHGFDIPAFSTRVLIAECVGKVCNMGDYVVNVCFVELVDNPGGFLVQYYPSTDV